MLNPETIYPDVPSQLWRFGQHAPRLTDFVLQPREYRGRTLYCGWGWQRIVGPMMVLSALLVFPFGIWYFGGFSIKGDREIFIAMCLAAGLAFLRVVWLVVTYPVLGLDLENAAFELRDGLLAKRVVDQGSLADLRVGVFRWHVYSRHRYGVDTHFAVIAYSGRG